MGITSWHEQDAHAPQAEVQQLEIQPVDSLQSEFAAEQDDWSLLEQSIVTCRTCDELCA